MKGEKLRHRLEHMGRKRAKTVKEGSSVRWRLKQVGVVRGEVKGGGVAQAEAQAGIAMVVKGRVKVGSEW